MFFSADWMFSTHRFHPWLNCLLTIYAHMRKKKKNLANLTTFPPFSIAFQNGHKLFIGHLELSLVEGTNWHLVTRVAEVHKRHYPGLLLWSWQVLLVDPICQSDCNKQWLGLACADDLIKILISKLHFAIYLARSLTTQHFLFIAFKLEVTAPGEERKWQISHKKASRCHFTA